MSNNELAHKIFNALFDSDELAELESRGFAECKRGYKMSCIAIIEIELDEAESER